MKKNKEYFINKIKQCKSNYRTQLSRLRKSTKSSQIRVMPSFWYQVERDYRREAKSLGIDLTNNGRRKTMHKFNLEIEIADKDRCNGCSCLFFDSYEVNFCGHGYTLPEEGKWSEKLHETIQPRPDICKQNDKEKTK